MVDDDGVPLPLLSLSSLSSVDMIELTGEDDPATSARPDGYAYDYAATASLDEMTQEHDGEGDRDEAGGGREGGGAVWRKRRKRASSSVVL